MGFWLAAGSGMLGSDALNWTLGPLRRVRTSAEDTPRPAMRRRFPAGVGRRRYLGCHDRLPGWARSGR